MLAGGDEDRGLATKLEEMGIGGVQPDGLCCRQREHGCRERKHGWAKSGPLHSFVYQIMSLPRVSSGWERF